LVLGAWKPETAVEAAKAAARTWTRDGVCIASMYVVPPGD